MNETLLDMVLKKYGNQLISPLELAACMAADMEADLTIAEKRIVHLCWRDYNFYQPFYLNPYAAAVGGGIQAWPAHVLKRIDKNNALYVEYAARLKTLKKNGLAFRIGEHLPPHADDELFAINGEDYCAMRTRTTRLLSHLQRIMRRYIIKAKDNQIDAAKVAYQLATASAPPRRHEIDELRDLFGAMLNI